MWPIHRVSAVEDRFRPFFMLNMYGQNRSPTAGTLSLDHVQLARFDLERDKEIDMCEFPVSGVFLGNFRLLNTWCVF